MKLIMVIGLIIYEQPPHPDIPDDVLSLLSPQPHADTIFGLVIRNPLFV